MAPFCLGTRETLYPQGLARRRLDAAQTGPIMEVAVLTTTLKDLTMTNTALATLPPRKLPMRALLMLLMCLTFQLAVWVLIAVAVLQLGFAVFSDEPNPRLQAVGRSLGRYLGQIAGFVSFATETLPFPFSDWPSTKV